MLDRGRRARHAPSAEPAVGPHDPAVSGQVPLDRDPREAGAGPAPVAGRPVSADMDKVFGPAFTNLYKGTWTPKQANDETVKATKDLIVKYLTT